MNPLERRSKCACLGMLAWTIETKKRISEIWLTKQQLCD
jgi:hypothetical protein